MAKITCWKCDKKFDDALYYCECKKKAYEYNRKFKCETCGSIMGYRGHHNGCCNGSPLIDITNPKKTLI